MVFGLIGKAAGSCPDDVGSNPTTPTQNTPRLALNDEICIDLRGQRITN
jgi:hypothetical protein